MVAHGAPVRSSEVHSIRSNGSIVKCEAVASSLVKQLEMATATSGGHHNGASTSNAVDLTDIPWPTILTTLVTTALGIRSTAVSALGLYHAPGTFVWLLMSAGEVELLTMSSHRAFAVAAETREKSLQKASYICSDIR